MHWQEMNVKQKRSGQYPAVPVSGHGGGSASAEPPQVDEQGATDAVDHPHSGPDVTYVAAVYAADGVRLLTAAPDSESLMARIAEYVAKQIDWLLGEEDARQVRRLLADGMLAEAVGLYFERVGRRWEKESLRVEMVQPGIAGSSEES
jgi:hypothetical protein